MAGQICFASFGVLLSGQPIKIAIQSGFSLAQIGEFAFIIAGLGLSLNVTDQYLYPIVVAVSVITTFFTPYMIRLAEPAYKWVERIIPENWKQFLERYSSGSNTIRQKSTWNKLLKALVRIVGTYTAVCLVLIFLWLQIVTPFICKHLPCIQGNLISLILILALISPMLRAIMMKKNHSVEFQQLWNGSPSLTCSPQNPALYRSRHASCRTVIEYCARNYAGGRFCCHRINDILQTAKETVNLDGTAFFQ